MTDDDMSLSKREILEKYPKGSPDYPSHAKGCGCSGCHASWSEWRGASKGFEAGIRAAVRACDGFAQRASADRENAINREDVAVLAREQSTAMACRDSILALLATHQESPNQ